MKILALITARKGSKRVVRKNARLLGGKPLIVWSIAAARYVPEICDILVSTDDEELALISKQAGAYVPWLRPGALAEDTTTSVDVALHALNDYEEKNGPVDGLLLLQPTSPFRTTETILRGIKLFDCNVQRAVIAVSRCHAHPLWTLKLDGDRLLPFIDDHGFGLRSQDLPPAYIVNGSLYLISPKELRSERSFLGVNPQPLIIKSEQEAIDIDTEWDFKVAELAASCLMITPPNSN